MTTKAARNRVKVYELDAESQWIDKGTGHVEIVHVEVSLVSLAGSSEQGRPSDP
jgi:hypothetical protein